MNYFSRLADRSGLASPRGAPAPRAAAGTPSPPADDAALPEIAVAAEAETAAPHPRVLDAAAPEPPRPIEADSAAHEQQDLIRVDAPIRPPVAAVPFRIDRPALAATTDAETASRESHDTVEIGAPTSLHGDARNAASTAAKSVAAASSQADTDAKSHAGPRMPQAAPANAAAAAVEVSVEMVQSPGLAATDRSAAGERQPSRVAEPAQHGDRGVPPVVRESVDLGRGDQREGAAPRFDRAASARSPGPEQRARNGSVEVRIGAVTLQVHAPPAAPVARVPQRFAPHRHYLRLW